MLRIRIRRILRYLGLLDPDPDPLVRDMDPDPSSKNSKKTLDSYVLGLLFDFLPLKNDVNIPSQSNKQKKLFFTLVFSWRLEA